MIRLFLAVLLLIAVHAAASAQAPDQKGRAPVTSVEKQGTNRPAASNSDADRYERGSEAVPIFTKAIATAKTQAESQQEAKDRKDNGRNNWWTLFLVALTAFFTGVGALIAGVQAGFFRSQLRIMREGLKDTAAAAQLASAQLQLARQEFDTTHRPKIVVREVYWDVVGGERFRITFIVANVGDRPAVIVGSAYEVARTDERPLLPGGDNALDATQIAAGEYRSFTVDVTEGHPITGQAYFGGKLFAVTFQGVIIYKPVGGEVVRRAVFKRRAENKALIFTYTGNSRDEYSD